MNIAGIAAVGSGTKVSTTQASTWSGASRLGGSGSVGRMKAAVGAVARLTGTTASNVVSQLGQGKSLASVAKSSGVSHAAVMASVTKAISTAVPQGSQPLSGSQLETVASRIVKATNVPARLQVNE